ncbi:MAG: 16S rRNA (cytidine(1402)-2'-O)-methyltransferase [Bacteroidales bacterium]|nr:16S rRNA (cytidine(1402)-2'-O)-methyltransferase [Bacteroidales bacterium]
MSKLILIPGPIGNLEDITLRALRILREETDLVLAEDTRKTGILLKHYGISKPMLAFHQHNEHRLVAQLVARLQSGERFSYLTDAGTPSISDPGFLLVRACIEEGVPVECLPGATAFVPALVSSGLPADRFCFEGFLPQKKGRQKRINALRDHTSTFILYESPHRLLKTLLQLAKKLGDDRKAVVARELTKIYEEIIRGSLRTLIDTFSQRDIKGEIVLIVEGKKDNTDKKEN